MPDDGSLNGGSKRQLKTLSHRQPSPPSRNCDAAWSTTAPTCSHPRTKGPNGLPRCTSSRWEYHFFTGSGFPFRSSPCARVRGLTEMLVDKIIIERHPSKIDTPATVTVASLPAAVVSGSLTIRSESLKKILGGRADVGAR